MVSNCQRNPLDVDKELSMAPEQNVFEQMIKADRENQESKHWSGTFIEYLERSVKTLRW